MTLARPVMPPLPPRGRRWGLLLGVVAGCATVGPWHQEGKTETQEKKDEWECAREVQSMFPWDRTKMFRLCMGARGWKEGGR